MAALKRIWTVLFLVICGAAGVAAAAPHARIELAATATNLVVTEEVRIAVRLWLPPLEGELAEFRPFLNQRPPHVTAGFLAPDWKSPALVPVDPRRLPPVPSRSLDPNVPVYTLNSYVSDDLFGGMRDPFALLDDDFFDRALGRREQRFPFQSRRVARDGVNGWEFSFETAPYRAAAPGRVEIAPATVKVPLIAGVRTGRDRFGRAVKVPDLKELRLQTKPLVLEVLEPPTAGRPADYCGALASNLTATATLDASVCTAGDPLMLTLDIAGANDAAAVHPPSFSSVLNAGGVFRLDEASLKTETLSAARRFTWRVRALKAGTVEFPALSVSYYDLGKRAYATVRTEMIPVQVKAGAQATLGALGDLGADAAAFPFPDGIDLDPRGARTEPLLPRLGLAVTLFVAAPVLFLLIRLTPPVRRRVVARRAARRRECAFAKCRRALEGRDLAKQGAAIRRFFADRYGVNGATVTAADARRLMAADFTAAEIALVAEALSDSDRLNYSAKKTIVSLLIVGLAALGSFAASTDFTYRRACSLAGPAVDEAGFRKAEAAFADCVCAGAANPVLFSNLGACAVMAGDPRAALAAYRRAERWGGETASTRRGVRAAWARIKNDPRADVPLIRLFLRPHDLFSLDARLVFAAAMWAVCWLLALLPAGTFRRLLLTCAALVCLATVVSVSVSLAEEAVAEGVVHVGQ